ETGKVRFETSDTLRYGREWDEINDLISKGYKIIQVADPKEPALRDLVRSGGEPVQYLIVRDVKEKPLSMNQVPYNEGGHWMYPQMGYYLKQAKTHGTARNRRVYDGDVTAHYFRTTAEAKEFQEAYETARQMLLRNDPGLDAFAASRLPYTGDEFRKLFKSPDNPDGVFDINSPFVTTESGQRVADVLNLADIFPEKLVDPSRSEHSLLGKINAEYAQERGERLTSVKNIGT